MSKQDLSIIIPVYNGQDYIETCLTSVMRQNGISNHEIIVVNDGSTDNTQTILKNFAKPHPNIHIITQKNGGVSIARNNGIRASHGKYITFIDCDDMVGLDANSFEPYFAHSIRQSSIGNMEIRNAHTIPQQLTSANFDNNFFANMLYAANQTNADVIMGGKITINPNDIYTRKHIYTYDCEYDTHIDDKHIVLRQADVRENANFALYKRKMLNEHKLRFLPAMKLDEDILFCMLATLYAERIATVTDVTYFYNRHENTLSNITDSAIQEQKYKLATLQRYSIFLNELKKYPKYDKIFTYWFKSFARKGMDYNTDFSNNFPPIQCYQSCPEKSCHGCFICDAMCAEFTNKIPLYLASQNHK